MLLVETKKMVEVADEKANRNRELSFICATETHVI